MKLFSILLFRNNKPLFFSEIKTDMRLRHILIVFMAIVGISLTPVTTIGESAPSCSIGDFVFEDANHDGCQDPVERPIEGVVVMLFEDCANPTPIASTTTNVDGFYEFTGLDCELGYTVQFGDAGAIYERTLPDQDCSTTNPPEPSDAKDSDCAQDDGFTECITFPDPVNEPNNPTIDCGYVCEGKIGDYVWLDENEDGCQDEFNTGIAGVDVTLLEDCVGRNNPKTVQTDANGFYLFEGLCPGEYFVEFGNGRPNTNPGQVCDVDPDVSDEKDSNCGDEALQCVELTKDNPEDPTIDCGKVGPCIELEKRVSGDGGVNFFDADNCSDADVPFTADDAEYKLIVTNCGKEAVTLDKIVDNDLGIFLTLDPTVTIQPNDSVEFTNDAGQPQGLLQKEDACPNPDDQFDNTATVFGMGAGSNQPVEATDPACVKCGPCIEIIKDVRDAENQSGDYQPADSCDDTVPINNGAEYRLTVTNCGAEDLRDVKINDLKLNITEFPVGILAAGETKVFFFDRPDGGIPELKQPTLCEDISSEVEFLNVSSVEGTGEESNLTVTDENPACVECQPECDVKVTKTCEILPSPANPLLGKCSGKLQEVVVIWDGTDSISLTPGAGVTSLSANQVDPGDVLTIFTDGSTNDVFVNISGSVSNGESKFHISCSDRDMNADNDDDVQQQLPGESQDCGKFQGNAKSTSGFINTWLLEGMVDADGLVLDCTPPEPFPTETEECEFTPQPEGGNCDDIKDITALTLIWDGPDGVNIASEIGQVINGINKGDIIILNTPKDQTGNDVDVNISGTVTGMSRFHISCSDDDMNGPEDCGSNQGNGKSDDSSLINEWLFGGMTGEKGSFSCPGVPGGPDSADVIYGIRVTNPNAEPVDVRIFDEKLGIDQMETILANDTFELVTDPITITPDAANEFTNTVVVTAETETGATCEASDSVTIKRNPPPPLVCTTKIAATLLRYIGPDMLSVDVEFVPKNKKASPVEYNNVNLISGVTVLSIDARPKDLGSKMSIFINGSLQEVHHTSCSTPYVAGAPAPLDGNSPGKPDKGDPSPNWFVESFVQK